MRWSGGIKLLAAEKIRDIRAITKRLKTAGTKIPVADENGNVQQHEDRAMPYVSSSLMS